MIKFEEGSFIDKQTDRQLTINTEEELCRKRLFLNNTVTKLLKNNYFSVCNGVRHHKTDRQTGRQTDRQTYR